MKTIDDVVEWLNERIRYHKDRAWAERNNYQDMNSDGPYIHAYGKVLEFIGSDDEALRQQYACDVCGNWPDSDGLIHHGKGCYVVSEDGGGESYVDMKKEENL